AATIYLEHPDLVHLDSPEFSASDRERLADACIEELVQQNEADPQSHLAKYRYLTKYRAEMAPAELERCLALAPQDPQVLLIVATTAYRNALQSRSQGEEQSKVRDQLTN